MSNFRLNVNGVVGNELYDVEVPGHDSIYIFVEVTIDPTGQNLPMVVQDSIVFSTNANLQDRITSYNVCYTKLLRILCSVQFAWADIEKNVRANGKT